MRRERGGGEVGRVAALAVGARRDDAPAELAGRGDAHRGRGTRPTFAQARHIRLPESPGPADGAKQLVRDQQGRPRRRPAGDQQREEFVIREGRRAARDQALSRTGGLRPFADGHARGISAAGCRYSAALPPACTVQSRSSKSFAQYGQMFHSGRMSFAHEGHIRLRRVRHVGQRM